KVMTAARTAPKGRGIDNLAIACADGDDLRNLAKRMKELAAETKMPFFERDADNILSCFCVVLIGTKISPSGMNEACRLCGFESCAAKPADTPCVFNAGDLGIALGSAASVAADERVDSRIMFSAGKAALELGLLGKGVKIAFALPLSVSGKSPFFDRK
ncbi:MAG: DUF2148 domain-containing protein, partial [Elusimicrobiaceae bacterium]